MTAHSGKQAQNRSHVLPMMALNLCTGTALQLMAQHVTDMDLADGRVQALAMAKYVFMLSFTSLQRWWSSRGRADNRKHGNGTGGPPAQPLPRPSPRARRLMVVIGVLDLVAYLLHCVGFMYCGAATASVVFAAACQTFTALLTRLVLRRKLSGGQLAAVGLVLLGIFMRGFGGSSAAAAGSKSPAGEPFGYLAILGSALGYALLGVTYDFMMRLDKVPPSHSQVMDLGSQIGLAVGTAYQVGYTLPRWQQLVGSHLRSRGTSGAAALAALAAFGAVIVLHTFVQGWVHRSEGAMAVGLVSATSSATVAIGASLLFCGPAAPWQCLTPRKALSGAVVMSGGIVWVLAGKAGGNTETKQQGPQGGKKDD